LVTVKCTKIDEISQKVIIIIIIIKMIIKIITLFILLMAIKIAIFYGNASSLLAATLVRELLGA